MLTGPHLGLAIAAAIQKKGVSKVAVARAFGVKPPSIQDWIKRGTIGKDKLTALWSYFSDVVGPAHWGLQEFPPGVLTASEPMTPFYEVLTDDDRRLLADFHALMDDDRAELAAEIRKRAERIRAHVRKVQERHGLPSLVNEAHARAPAARARTTASAIAARQRSLLDDP